MYSALAVKYIETSFIYFARLMYVYIHNNGLKPFVTY